MKPVIDDILLAASLQVLQFISSVLEKTGSPATGSAEAQMELDLPPLELFFADLYRCFSGGESAACLQSVERAERNGRGQY